MTPAAMIVAALGGLLACSLAGNAYLARSILEVRDERTQAIGERDQARSAADTCSEATEALRTAADKRAKDAQLQLAAARKATLDAQGRAQHILSTPPTVPGDDCRSASDRVRNWIKGRARP